MRVLFLADVQAEWGNLDQCKTVWLASVEECLERGLEAVAVLGDIKHQYNPVDVRVIRFWTWAVTYAKGKGLRVIFILGNHDRVGQYTDSQNWFPILRRVGAEAYDKPEVVKMYGGGRLFVLPFDSSVARLRESADRLLREKPNPQTDILVFHANLKDCLFNKLGQFSEGKLRVDDLHPGRYLYCIGGDIHLPQKIGRNTYYVGSPFCMDWGEANQRKRFIVVEDGRMRFLPSPVPGFYDTSWPGFDRRDVTKDSRIRIHVKCPTDSDYGRVLEKARRDTERRYPGASVYTVPEFAEGRIVDIGIKTTDSDATKIKAYVSETLEGDLRKQEKKVVQLLAYLLEKAGGGAPCRGSGLIFRKATAKNFLSFKRLEVDYSKPGIVVVQGTNEDWHGRSNGSGKTSYLQPIPVALFGTTFKGQKYDKWARRGAKGSSWSRLVCRAGDKRIDVIRGRRPNRIQLIVNGKDQSSGLRGSLQSATQGLIEQVTGFTWQTLANAVYIDHSVTRAFLGGTRKERTDVLSKFQGLERFTKALELVRQQKIGSAELEEANQEEIAVARAKLEGYEEALDDAKKSARHELRAARKKWRKSRRAVKHAIEEYDEWVSNQKPLLRTCRDKQSELSAELATFQDSIDRLLEKKSTLTIKIDEAEALVKEGKCPTCKQDVDVDSLSFNIKEWRVDRQSLSALIVDYEEKVDGVKTALGQAEEREERLKEKQADREQDIRALKSAENHLKNHFKGLWDDTSTSRKTVVKYVRRVRTIRTRLRTLKRYREELRLSQNRLLYCEQAFSRDGIPAFLNSQLVPVLNKAAEYYAELFCDKHIQVRFEVEEGEFEPIILNATGGEELDDQSVGEKALAGLITSFALREVAPTCNVLVLDEPGDGLDVTNARQFARALPQLVKRFGQIVVTSHNPVILSELEDCRTVVVKKRNGVSRVV